MIRLFYAAAASLLVSVCIEQAFAQSVSLSPGVVDAASAPRYRNAAKANLDRVPGPSPEEQSLQRERCATLSAAQDDARNYEFDQNNGPDFANNSWADANGPRSMNRQRELDRQSTMLGCPKKP